MNWGVLIADTDLYMKWVIPIVGYRWPVYGIQKIRKVTGGVRVRRDSGSLLHLPAARPCPRSLCRYPSTLALTAARFRTQLGNLPECSIYGSYRCHGLVIACVIMMVVITQITGP